MNAHEFVTIHFGHHDIKDDEVGFFLSGDEEGITAVFCCDYLEAALL